MFLWSRRSVTLGVRGRSVQGGWFDMATVQAATGSAMGAAQTSAKRGHFVTLDGLRGVAALAVVIFHRRWWFDTHFIDHAYLAVDFFFLLSGFVIACAYSDRLRSGRMSVTSFVRIRVVRLWPLIVLGALLGSFVLIGQAFADGSRTGILKALIALPLAALVLPAPAFLTHQPFSVNQPSWSLFFEFIANLAYGMVARWLTERRLIVIVAISAVMLAGVILFSGYGIGVGYRWSTLLYGIPRVLFPFFFGLLIYEWYKRGALPAIGMPIWVLALALIAVLAMPGGAKGSQLVNLVAVFIVFPLIVMSGCQREPSGRWKTAAVVGAELSYPIYVLHMPLLDMLDPVIRQVPLGTAGRLALLVAVIATVSMLASRFFDAPLRDYLKRRALDRGRRPVQDPA